MTRRHLAILFAGILTVVACRKAEVPGSKAGAAGSPAGGLSPTIPRQNWRVTVGDRVAPKDIAVSEKQGHAVVWEAPQDPAAKIHVVFDIPPYTWNPFPNLECPDAAHAANPCNSRRISPLARGRKYTYHVFLTSAQGSREIDPTIIVDY